MDAAQTFRGKPGQFFVSEEVCSQGHDAMTRAKVVLEDNQNN